MTVTTSPLDGLATIDASHATTIGPEHAEALLALNHDNRSLSESRVEYLIGVLERGEWQLNGDTISVSSDYQRLLNGQHRLHAVLRSGKPITTFLAVVNDGAQVTMDRGRTRTFADYLHMHKEPYPNEVGAIVANIWAYRRYGFPSRQSTRNTPSIEQLVEIHQAHSADIMESLRAVGKTTIMSRSFAASHHFVFAEVDRADADDFFEKLRLGTGLEAGNPILTLRERLLKERDAAGNLPIRTRSAFMFIAFNHFRRGETLQKMIFRAGGANPQDFPTLWQ